MPTPAFKSPFRVRIVLEHDGEPSAITSEVVLTDEDEQKAEQFFFAVRDLVRAAQRVQ